MKKTKKNVVPKDRVKDHGLIHHTVAARMQPKAKNAGLRSKSDKTQVRKPKKNSKE
jgi:hypothetical protein